jgi:5'-methylthioadenosine phosphorylase
MSVLPEAKLFREAELGYALICMSTDYDSWHSTNETVSVDMVMGHLAANSHNATRVIDAVLVALAAADDAHVAAVREGSAWEGASRGGLGMTKEEGRGKEAVERLRWLFPEYF